MTDELPKLSIDKERPGIIRFEDGDEFAGILAGIKSAEIVRRCNEYPDLMAFVREVAAIDPLSGGGPSKYFVTGELIARARALAGS